MLEKTAVKYQLLTLYYYRNAHLGENKITSESACSIDSKNVETNRYSINKKGK